MIRKQLQPPVYLVSACLLGLRTRYDGRVVENAACRQAVGAGIWIPFCPEQLGGLATPRPAADLFGGDGMAVLDGRAQVVTRAGKDVSEFFLAGARQVLQLASSQPITAVFLKARSPSCGLTPLLGVTAALLARHGFVLREF